MATPYYTSNDLVAAVQRKIALPLSNVTFEPTDILAFANEEMMISQVSEILSYHEEYFVFRQSQPLLPNKLRYSIPDRAIGMRLRNIFYQDQQGNMYEMTRTNPDDQAFFQTGASNNQNIHKYFLEGNDVVLLPSTLTNPTGSLIFCFFLRPNQLVTNDRAAIISSFGQTITIGTPNPNDTVTINSTVFTAVASGATGYQFNIGASPIITATNLATVINTAFQAQGITLSAVNGTPATAIITLSFSNFQTTFLTSNATAFVIPSTTIIFNCGTVSTSVFMPNILIDVLQTKPGHRTYAYDVLIPANGITGNAITLPIATLPNTILVGDYLAQANECIIPQIPPDLHNVLAERVCQRILAAQGDNDGLTFVDKKLQDMYTHQGTLLDNRNDGNPQKILARHSLLRYGKNRRGTL